MLEFFKKAIGVGDFTESRKQQRQWGNNLVRLMQNLGREVFAARANSILADDFKRKNCGSLQYLYKQIKGFVETKKQVRHDVNGNIIL